MKKSAPAADPDAYVAALQRSALHRPDRSSWQASLVERLRSVVRKSARLEETIKWGHLVYFSNGPVLLIRAEEKRVLFGFWRGKRLRDIEPRLKAGGKYEMATLVLSEDTELGATTIRRLAREAVALNAKIGDPTRIGKKPASRAEKAGPQKAKAKAKAKTKKESTPRKRG